MLKDSIKMIWKRKAFRKSIGFGNLWNVRSIWNKVTNTFRGRISPKSSVGIFLLLVGGSFVTRTSKVTAIRFGRKCASK
jgi:hypothetical protein